MRVREVEEMYPRQRELSSRKERCRKRGTTYREGLSGREGNENTSVGRRV